MPTLMLVATCTSAFDSHSRNKKAGKHEITDQSRQLIVLHQQWRICNVTLDNNPSHQNLRAESDFGSIKRPMSRYLELFFGPLKIVVNWKETFK